MRAVKLGELAAEFDAVHDVRRAQATGSVDRIIAPRELRPYIVDSAGSTRAGARTLTGHVVRGRPRDD